MSVRYSHSSGVKLLSEHYPTAASPLTYVKYLDYIDICVFYLFCIDCGSLGPLNYKY